MAAEYLFYPLTDLYTKQFVLLCPADSAVYYIVFVACAFNHIHDAIKHAGGAAAKAPSRGGATAGRGGPTAGRGAAKPNTTPAKVLTMFPNTMN